MKPSVPTIRIADVLTSKLGAGGAGDLVFTISPSAAGKTAVITLAGIQWSYTVAPASDEELIVLVNTFADASLRFGIRQAGPNAIYFNPAWEFVLVRTAQVSPSLVISLSDPGGGGGNFWLNLLGYSFREFDTPS